MSNWPDQKIGGAKLGFTQAKLPKVGSALAPPAALIPHCIP